VTESIDFTWGVQELEEIGFVRVYNFMLRVYTELGLTRNEMLLIIHLASYSYNVPGSSSHPSLETIAQEMGATRRGVRKMIASLRQKGMLSITPRPGDTSLYDLSGFAVQALRLWRQKQTQSRNSASEGGRNPRSQGVGTPVPRGRNPRSQGVGTGVPPKKKKLRRTSKEEFKKKKDRAANAADRPPGKKSPRSPPGKKTKRPPAIERFRQATHRFPAKAWWAEIAGTVGEAEANLDRWGAICYQWVGLGWNPTNVAGMLEYYRTGQMPGQDRKTRPRRLIVG